MKRSLFGPESFLVVSAILAIAVDIGISRLGYGLALPAIRLQLPGPYGVYGAIGTLHFVGYLAGTLVAPPLLRRDPGGRRSAIASHAAAAILLLASAAAGSLVVFGVERALLGVAGGLGVAAVVTGTLERVSVVRRPSVNGRAWAGIGAGIVLSALAAPAMIAHPNDWRIASVGAAGVALLAAVMLAIAFSEDVPLAAPASEVPFRIGDLVQPRRYLFLACAYFCFGTAYTAFATFFVAALRAANTSSAAIAVIWAAYGVATFVGGLYVGRIMGARRDGLSIVLGFGAVGSAIVSFHGAFTAIAGALAVGLGLAAAPAIATALARARSSAGTSAAAFVAVTAILGAGQIAGPWVAGAFADRFGPSAASVFAGSVYALGAVLAFIDAHVAGMPQAEAAHAVPGRALRAG